MTDQAETTSDTEKAIGAFIALRNKRSEIKRAYEEEDDKLKERLEKLQVWFMKKLEAAGSDQLKIQGLGTVYKQTKTKSNAADWPTVWQFMKDNDRMDFLEKRLSQTAVTKYIEEMGAVPPGVNIFRETEIVVRKD